MRVAVVGLGGVGGYIATYLVKAGVDVVGFARGAHLEAIRSDALVLIEDSEHFRVKIDARSLETLEKSTQEHFDLVLFCVKSYDLKDAYLKIAPYTDDTTVLLSFSNGVSNGDLLRSLSRSRVLDGCVYVLSHIESAGVIRKKGDVFAAVFGGEAGATSEVASLFEHSGVRYKTPQNIKEALWKKYLFISAFATLTSYYNKSIHEIYEAHFDEAKTLLEEIAAFAKSEGVDLDEEVQKALQTASKLPKDATTSMHKDFTLKKQVELESLSGYVKTPLMQRLYTELKARV